SLVGAIGSRWGTRRGCFTCNCAAHPHSLVWLDRFDVGFRVIGFCSAHVSQSSRRPGHAGRYQCSHGLGVIMSTAITDTLGQHIAAKILKQPKRVLRADEALISSGLIDSFSLVDLALYVEDEFGVRIDDSELNAA